jgi:type VI secretion system secreted protein VgrG
MEAVVEFIEGDPDRPLVVGTVYNANNMPPWACRRNKTQRGLKTRSSTGRQQRDLQRADVRGQEGQRARPLPRREGPRVDDRGHREAHGQGQEPQRPGRHCARKTKIEKGDDKLDVENGDRKITISRHRTEDIGRNETVTVGDQPDHHGRQRDHDRGRRRRSRIKSAPARSR